MSRSLLPLISVAVAGQALTYGLALAFARMLGAAGFEAYVVAAAVFLVLVAVAPLGLDKYALRRLPALIERGDLPAARAFARFASSRVAMSALASMALGVAFVFLVTDGSGPLRNALLLGCLAVPAAALAHLGLEVLAAGGRIVLAGALLRLVLPALALVAFVVAVLGGIDPTGASAIGAWTLAWFLFLPLACAAAWRAMPAALWSVAPGGGDPDWRGAALTFWVHRVAMAMMANISVIGLEIGTASPVAVAAYAAALATVTTVRSMVASTNRLYARHLAIGLERGEAAATLKQIRRMRLRWLLPTVATFAIAALVLAPFLIGLFGSELVADGVPALRLLAAAAVVSMILGPAPTYLKFTGRRDVLLYAVIAAGAVQVMLLVLLAPRYGAAGAAAAYAVSTAGLYGACGWFAWGSLERAGRAAAGGIAGSP